MCTLHHRRKEKTAIGVMTNETVDDFYFVFNAISTNIFEIHGVCFEPQTLVADGADAIKNAFYKNFRSANKNVMCYAHVIRNVNKQRFKKLENKKEIKKDLQKLQTAPTSSMFQKGLQLFLKKYKNKQPSFCKYFLKEYVRKHPNWFECYAFRTPSTNNALEATNNALKAKFTLREKLPLARFNNLLLFYIVQN